MSIGAATTTGTWAVGVTVTTGISVEESALATGATVVSVFVALPGDCGAGAGVIAGAAGGKPRATDGGGVTAGAVAVTARAPGVVAGWATCAEERTWPLRYVVMMPVAWSNTTWSALSSLAADADQPRVAVIPKTVVEVSPVARILPIVAWRLVVMRGDLFAARAAMRSLRSVVIVVVLVVVFIVVFIIVVFVVIGMIVAVIIVIDIVSATARRSRRAAIRGDE